MFTLWAVASHTFELDVLRCEVRMLLGTVTGGLVLHGPGQLLRSVYLSFQCSHRLTVAHVNAGVHSPLILGPWAVLVMLGYTS
jgi:hypothetical protein